jgi:hypothetical protein
MAIGDEALAAGMNVVPETGEEGKRKHGAREINRTRDYIARLLKNIPSSKSGFRNASGITVGTGDPSGGDDGDIHFKVI